MSTAAYLIINIVRPLMIGLGAGAAGAWLTRRWR